MGQKIYIVKRAIGEYESYYEYIDKAFYEQDKADNYVSDKNAMYKRLESYRDEWKEIETLLDNAVPDNYWSDTKETFINAVKKTLPELYEKHGEAKLLEMYDYFETCSFKYTYKGQPCFYITEAEIE